MFEFPSLSASEIARKDFTCFSYLPFGVPQSHIWSRIITELTCTKIQIHTYSLETDTYVEAEWTHVQRQNDTKEINWTTQECPRWRWSEWVTKMRPPVYFDRTHKHRDRHRRVCLVSTERVSLVYELFYDTPCDVMSQHVPVQVTLPSRFVSTEKAHEAGLLFAFYSSMIALMP